MNERIRPERASPDPGSGADLFENSPDVVAPVSVSSGPYAEQLPVGNRRVGEIRRLLGARLDLDPQSQAVLDGNDVDDDVVVRPGQALMFTRRAGEKGTALSIRGAEVTATSPEGQSASMPLDTFLSHVAGRRMDTGGVILPDGVKAVLSTGPITMWIHERPPGVHRFQWIAPNSPSPFGPGTVYRPVRLALPYVIMVIVFAADDHGQLRLTQFNECFFRNAPLKSLEDPLCFPALLNCSRFEPPDGRPLSWICTQHLKVTPAMRQPDAGRRATACFEAVRHCLLETAFNLSSEHHEHSSWFTESQFLDARIATVEAWEAATAADSLFALEVPWRPTGLSVRQLADRIFKNQNAHTRTPRTATALARHVFHHHNAPAAASTPAPADESALAGIAQLLL